MERSLSETGLVPSSICESPHIRSVSASTTLIRLVAYRDGVGIGSDMCEKARPGGVEIILRVSEPGACCCCCCCRRVKESGGVGSTEGERELERGREFGLIGVCGSAASLDGE
jgi:hypothetical protein